MTQIGERERTGCSMSSATARRPHAKSCCTTGRDSGSVPSACRRAAFTWGPSAQEASARLSARELAILFWNGNPQQAGMAEDWRKLASGRTWLAW